MAYLSPPKNCAEQSMMIQLSVLYTLLDFRVQLEKIRLAASLAWSNFLMALIVYTDYNYNRFSKSIISLKWFNFRKKFCTGNQKH